VTLERSDRIAVLSKTLAFGMAYLLAIVSVNRFYLNPRVVSRELSLAMSIAFVQCATIAVLLAFSFCKKLARQVRESRAARVSPAIRELLALQAAGNDHCEDIRQIQVAYPRELEQCLVEFLRMVRGGGRELLAQLAFDLRLIKQWQRQFRSRNLSHRKKAVAHLALVPRKFAGDVLQQALLDPDESVRLHTARHMVSNLEPGELPLVFALVVNGSLVARMVLAEDLRPYALELAKEAIPAVLVSGKPAAVGAALDVLRAWGKFLPLPQVYPLLRHADPGVRVAALRILPLVPRFPQLEMEVLHALNDPVEAVRAMAVRIAAKFGISNALPQLVRCLHDQDARTAAAAAHALAQLGADGCRILEQEMVSGPQLAASAALEALQRLQTAPAETVAV
jgi:HEAT repeat protein